MKNLKRTEIQRPATEDGRKKGEDKTLKNKKTENHNKWRLTTLKRLKRGEKPKTGEGGR